MPVRHPMSRGELDTNLTIKGAWTFNADQAFLGDVDITGDLTAGGVVRLTGTGDAGLATTLHPFQVGNTGAINIRIDGNEIMAVDNGVAATLAMNADGGTVTFFNAVAGAVEIRKGSTLSIFDSTGSDKFVGSHDGSHFNFAATNTVDVNFTGHSGNVVLPDASGIENASGGELTIHRLSLTDDATGTVTVGNKAIVMVSSGFNENAGLAAFITFQQTPVFMHTLGTATSYGDSANPDVDGDANYWKSSSAVLSVKNRLGSTRTFTIYAFTDQGT